MPTAEEITLCNEALDIAREALMAVLERRPDMLDEPDSTSRSLRLILGCGPLGIEETVGIGE